MGTWDSRKETQVNPEREGGTTVTHGCVQQIPTDDIRKHQRAIAAGTSVFRGSGWFWFYILGLALLTSPLLRGQEAPPAVMAGTKLRVQFDSEVGTAISRVNDGMEVHLLKPVGAQGRDALPVGTVLSGRVIGVRKGDKHTKTYAMIRLAFNRVTLPDGRSFPVQASLADLGVSEYVDSEGAASTVPPSKGRDIGTAAASAGVGAGVGAIAGGAKGAGVGAGVGAGIDALGTLAEHLAQWDDFTLKKGRKAWLRLDTDLILAPPQSDAGQKQDTKGAGASAELPEGPASPPTDEKSATLPPSHPPILTQSAPSASSTASNLEQPLHSVVLGEWRTTPTYVDTGPFAAAKEQSYWQPTATQFVVVTNKFEGLYNAGTPCSISRVRLEVNTGAEYHLVDEDALEADGRWPDEVRRSKWVFKVKPGEKPTGLLVLRPGEEEGKCPSGNPSPWPKLGTDRVSLSLGGLPSLNDIAEVEQHSAPVRLGQLEITLTTVGLASGDWDGVGFLTPKHGHHEVVISLAMKNVSEYPNCTMVLGGYARLFDNRSFEYPEGAAGFVLTGAPGLLPGEATGSNVKFEIWDGTAPALLTISRNIGLERSCNEKQHRPVDMHGGSAVRIPIAGVPAVSAAAQR